MPAPESAIIVVIDGLRASALGAYGHTSVDVPALNRLAAESIVFDWAFTDSTDLLAATHALWEGRHPLAPPGQSLLEGWRDAGGETVLVTDEAKLVEGLPANAFDDVVMIPAQAPAVRPLAETELARFFTVLLERTLTLRPGTLVWAHARGWHGAWDAPAEFRQQLAGPEDPPPPDFVTPPARKAVDPFEESDLILGWQLAYGGQVRVLDQLLELFLEQAGEVLDDTWFALTSLRGFPLGEHGRMGGSDWTPHAENTQVPLLIRPPGCREAAQRSQRLTGPALLSDRIGSGFRMADGASLTTGWKRILPQPEQEVVWSASSEGDALRTQAWSLIGKPGEWELYVRPDDRWEFNNVADRCPEVVEELAALHAQLREELAQGRKIPASGLSRLVTQPNR